MKHKLLFFLASLTLLVSSCVKDPEPNPISRFSVLGDSFSSFKGYVDPAVNDVWVYYDTIGVTEPEQMWWYQVAVETGWTMEKNNSFSGSLICNYDALEYFGPHSFIRRMDHLGNPDVIFVFGGTNDVIFKVPLGDYVYADWTEEQLCTFRPAMAYLFSGLKRLYPLAEIYFMVDMELCIDDVSLDNETRRDFIDSMHHIANHYNVNCIDISGIRKSWWHPNAMGQEDIARQVLEVMRNDFNV